MKILHATPHYSPSVGGAQEVVRQISERLVERGHDVTVATSYMEERGNNEINGVKIEEFDVSGKYFNGFKGECDKYQEFLLDSDFDIALFYAAQTWSADLAFPLLEELQYSTILAACGFSGLYWPRWSEYFKVLPFYLHKFNHHVFHSNTYRDIEFAKQHGVKNISVIPNGADEREFGIVDRTFRARNGIPEDVFLILNVSSHFPLKGHKFSFSVINNIKNDMIFLLNGNIMGGNDSELIECQERAKEAKHKVILSDFDRSDVIAAYQAADLFLFTSKVECSPLVLFEAMASRTPFITSECGNANEIVDWSDGGICVRSFPRYTGAVEVDTVAMSKKVDELIENSAERERMVQNGYSAWEKCFAWDIISEKYEKLYESVAGS